MNQKHTPGPWQHASAFVNNAPNVFVVTAGKWGAPNIAQCSNENDARLIAAAPDMLAALEEAAFWNRHDLKHIDDISPDRSMLRERARVLSAAIKRARSPS